jgi:hypothetical protein
MYNPPNATAPEVAAGHETSDFEFIEIKNVGALPVDLRDVRFTKGIDFDFVAGSILVLSPGEFALVVRTMAAFELRYGSGLPIAGEYAPDNLSNGGENVKLSFGAGIPIHEFTYRDSDPWPSAADGLGYSLVLIDPASRPRPDHALPTSWRASRGLGGSPGADDGDFSLPAWKAARFLAEDLGDDARTGDLVDLDGDGMPTVLEYAFAANPKRADSWKLPMIVEVPNGGDKCLGLRFRRRSGATDLRYLIESSGNLVDWTPARGVVLNGIEANADGSFTETWRLPAAMGDAAEVFLRLRVTVK